MESPFRYDIFVSYATANRELAEHIVTRIEARGFKCFIAPRDMRTGEDYASEIVRAISNSAVVLLIFSSAADKSGYVLREINSAVSRNKTVIPFRIENFLPSEAMEFYLGPTHWLDAYPNILDTHLDSLEKELKALTNNFIEETKKDLRILEPTLLKISELVDIGYDYKKITMKELEIDYLCISPEKFKMDEETEGTFDEWLETIKTYEEDTSVILVKKDEIIGYCDIYPVTDESYEILMKGKAIVRNSMIDLYMLGGEFNAYIAMIAITPNEATQTNYILFLKWIIQHVKEWAEKKIYIKNIGISVYSDMLEKFVIRCGFHYAGQNPAGGKIYEQNAKSFMENQTTIAILLS